MLSIGAQLAIPLIAKAAIDGPIHDGNKRGLVPLLILAISLGLFELSLTYRRRLALAKLATTSATTSTSSSSGSRSGSTTAGNRASCSHAQTPTSR
jgi:ABC-type bacteriocin/lantibiotic exporter with double-glycine peptidase domain